MHLHMQGSLICHFWVASTIKGILKRLAFQHLWLRRFGLQINSMALPMMKSCLMAMMLGVLIDLKDVWPQPLELQISISAANSSSKQNWIDCEDLQYRRCASQSEPKLKKCCPENGECVNLDFNAGLNYCINSTVILIFYNILIFHYRHAPF